MDKIMNSRKFFIILVILALVFVLPNISHAATPAGTTRYIQINITNSQTTATGTDFQQMVNLSLSGLKGVINQTKDFAFQNVQFFNSTTGAVIDSWLENYSFAGSSPWALYWIKLPNGIGASTTIKSVAVGFGANTTNFFNTNTTGEAPQLSSTYGEYDNGANVFTNYWNFAGTTLPTGWTNSGITYTVNNGISATATAASGYIGFGTAMNVGNIIEGYGNIFESTSNWVGLGIMTVPVVNENGYQGMAISTGDGNTGAQPLGTYQGTQTEASTFTTTGGNTAANQDQIWSVSYISTSSSAYFTNYAQIGATITTPVVSNPLYPAIFEAGAGAAAYTFPQTASFIWVRIRVIPPNGVMPSMTQGPLNTIPAVSLYLQSLAADTNATGGNAITYGTTSTFTANISSGFVELWTNVTGTLKQTEPLTHLTVTYSRSYLAAGYYEIIAGSNTSGIANVTLYEKINKATPTLSITDVPGNFIYNGTKDNTSAAITTVNDQLTATLYIDGASEGSSTTRVSYLNATVGTYSGVFNTSGGQNYTSASVQTTSTISKAVPAMSAVLNLANGTSKILNGLSNYNVRVQNSTVNFSDTVISTNDLNLTLFLDGKLVRSHINSYGIYTLLYDRANLGKDLFVLNTTGNANYSTASLSGSINLTSNVLTLYDDAQNGASLAFFNLTVKNSTTIQTYKNLAAGTAMLYQDLPLNSPAFNFSSSLYNWSINTTGYTLYSAPSALKGTNWEWIYFNVENKQTSVALTDYGFNLTDDPFKYFKGSTNDPVQISLQKLYPGTVTAITNLTGYNTTKTVISFDSLSPATNTYTIFMSEAALTIYVRDSNTNVLFPNATMTIANDTATQTFTNITTPLSKSYLQIPLGNITITVSRDFPTKTTWTTSTYYVTMSADAAINLTTYIFNASDKTTLTFQVQNAYGNTVSSAIVYLENTGPLNDILSECKTLGAGQCQIYGDYGSSYLYYAALPFTYQVSAIDPLYTLASGSAGICPSGIWCAYLQTVLPTLAALPFANISYSPQDSFLAPNATIPFFISYSTTKNDVSLFEDNYSVYANDTLVHSVLYTFSGNPTEGSITFDQTMPASSFTSDVKENISIVQNGVISSFQLIYYVEGSPGGAATNSTSLADLSSLFTGLGPAGGMIFFWIVLVGVAILMWVLSGSVLATMLIMDAVTGLFAFFNVFSGVVSGYGSYLGWGMFALFSFFTVAYQMSKIGGLG